MKKEKFPNLTPLHGGKPNAGEIIAHKRIPIDPDNTALTLFRKLEKPAAGLLREGKAPRTPQDPRSGSYFGGRKPEDERIDWQRSAEEIYNLVRTVAHPYPGAFTFVKGRKLFVWKAEFLLVESCQLENGQEGSGEEIVRSFSFSKGERLA